MESPALMPFLPGLSRRFLGEKLKIPSVATWWCGQEQALEYVRDNLDSLVIKPSFAAQGVEPVFGGQLSRRGARQTARADAGRPCNFAGQEVLHLSTVPVWSDKTPVAAARGAAGIRGRGGRFVGSDAGRTGASIAIAGFAGGLHAARGRQQRHVGALGYAGG